MAADTVPVGELRWRVEILSREQSPAAQGAGIDEDWVLLGTRQAKIEALRPLTFWTAFAGEQTDRPVTHMIWMRFISYPSTTWVVRRTTLVDGVPRVETFRVRRAMEMQGRKRFLQIEAELERVA